MFAPLKKPTWRGYLHQEAFFVTLGASVLLIAKSSSSIAFEASLVYSLGLLLLFGVSAIYHRPQWQIKTRALLKRLDHSCIFILIASTFTPICIFALSKVSGERLLLIVWIAALVGIFQSIFWVKAPKFLTAILYVIMGWLVLPYLQDLRATMGVNQILLLIAGGVLYTVGALFYAFKRPVLFPSIFGYHELFHLFTILAAAFHFAVIYQLIN